MMNCAEAQELLIDHAHDELVGDKRLTIVRHLAGCRDCALEYCRLQADLRGVAEAHVEAPRARVFHQLRRRVAAEHARGWWSGASRVLTRPVPIYKAMLAGLVPVGVWFVIAIASNPRGPDDRSPVDASAPPSLIDYDATTRPTTHRDVL
jgi:anti-sigma factor RsiW